MAVGAPECVIDAIVERKVKDLHMIVIASDWENRGVGKLVVAKLLKSAQVSHLGTNKAIQAQMNAGEMEIELVPQGTLMERVRAFGAGLGGILTPTGLGTVVEDG
ncbi:MAG: branched-chain amino acid dehydrogenase, partial [Candidatus Cloacimonetes bacterium]|nr:branched-chain amino acid dehydrogenase [Candidatus Cloacimonadota bacterium]